MNDRGGSSYAFAAVTAAPGVMRVSEHWKFYIAPVSVINKNPIPIVNTLSLL